MASLSSLLTTILFTLCILYGAAQSLCSRGEKLLHVTRAQSDVCVPCEEGTFMDEDNHSHTACNSCTFIEDPNVEMLVNVCNKTQDSVILCASGFYRRRARDDRQNNKCEKCTQCPHPTRACQGYHDTVCCHPDQDAVMTTSGVFVCEERPVVCRPGQFFNTSSEECLPCPAGTFMSAHNHTYKECLKCEQLSDNNATHAIITRPCSRTAPTLFGCEGGYFRDPTQESLQTEVPCTPCKSCRRRLTDCGMFHNAVCDDKEEIIVVNSSASGDESEHEKPSLEINMKSDNETWDDVENASQSNVELPRWTESVEMRVFWFVFVIVGCLLLLFSLSLLFILFNHLNYLKANCDNTRYISFKHQNQNKMLASVALHALCICVLVGTLVKLSITNPTDKLELAVLSTAIILIILVSACLIIIYCIKANRIPQQCSKITQARDSLSAGGENQCSTGSQEKLLGEI